MKKILVVGIGNPDRGDDAAGLLIARRLVEHVSPEVSIIERTGDLLAVIQDWVGYDAVVLVDAAALVTTAGSIHRIDLLEDQLPPELSLSSTHALGVGSAVGLARTLGLLPQHLVVFAVEGASFEAGSPLSPDVSAAVDEAVMRVLTEITLLNQKRVGATANA